MKKQLLAVLCGCITLCLHAQISIQPTIPAVGLVQKSQLWNILVVNSTNVSYTCRLELMLKDRMTGQDILTAATGQFTLAVGAKQMNVNSLNPIQYNYLSTGLDSRMLDLLPAGSYNACYTLTLMGVKDEHLAEECIPFDVAPLSPPALIFPADSAKMETPSKQFSWTTPTPSGMFDKLFYELIITEINENQKPAEALQENLPFFVNSQLFNNSFTYPSSANQFEKNKWYAWQIVAKDDKSYVGKSEVWVFQISQEDKKVEPTNESYIFINSNGSDTKSFQVSGKMANIKYYSFDREFTAQITIKTTDGKTIQQIKQKLMYGDNYFQIPMSHALQVGHTYKMEIEDANHKLTTYQFSVN